LRARELLIESKNITKKNFFICKILYEISE